MAKLGSTILLVDGKLTNDSSDHAVGTGKNLGAIKCKNIWVYVTVGGTSNPTWDITPKFGNSTANAYFNGITRTVESGNTVFGMSVDYASDFYIDCRNQQGTTPSISIWIQPILGE